MRFFNKQFCSLLILGLFLVIAVSLVNGVSLIEGHSKTNKNSTKALSSWQKNNKKKLQSTIDNISSSSDAAAAIPKLQTMFDLDDAAAKSLKLAAGGGLFGSFGDGDSDNDSDNDSDAGTDSDWL